jgi:RHS repeat-associated protein
MTPGFASRSNTDFDWLFTYHGEFFDDETGYINYGYRFYSPTIGRWLSRDPIAEEGGVNLYAFVGNRTTNEVDQLGQTPVVPVGAVVIGSALLGLGEVAHGIYACCNLTDGQEIVVRSPITMTVSMLSPFINSLGQWHCPRGTYPVVLKRYWMENWDCKQRYEVHCFPNQPN